MLLVYQIAPAKEGKGRKTRQKFLEITILESRLCKKSVSLSFAGFPVYDIDESAILLAVFD